MKRVKNRNLSFLGKFYRQDKGAVAVETALIMVLLLTIALGVLDYGLLLSRKMEVTNAVRAGAQYALVRKPKLNDPDPYAAIIDATRQGLNDNSQIDPTSIDITAVLSCSCGSTVSACVGTDPDPTAPPSSGDDLICPSDGVRRSAYLTIKLSLTYKFIFGFVGVPTINISDFATVRLN